MEGTKETRIRASLPDEEHPARASDIRKQSTAVEAEVVVIRVEAEGQRGAPGNRGAVEHRGVAVASEHLGVGCEAERRLNGAGEQEPLGQVLDRLPVGLDPQSLEGVGEVETVDRTIGHHLDEPIVAGLHDVHLTDELALAVVDEPPIGEGCLVGPLHAREQNLLERGTVVAHLQLGQLERETDALEEIAHLRLIPDLLTQLDDGRLEVLHRTELEAREGLLERSQDGLSHDVR